MTATPSLYKRHRATFHLFPALLPLAEIVPWVLTLIAAATGAAGVTNALARHRKLIFALSALCIVAASAVILISRPDAEVRATGTKSVPAHEIPQPQLHGSVDTAPAQAASSFTKIWETPVKKQILSSPVLSGDALFYGTYQGSVEAIAIDTGKPRWSLPQNHPVFTMAVDPDGVYAGEGLHETKESALTAINPANGTVRWSRKFLGHIEEAPTPDHKNNRIFTGAGPGGLWALNKTDGSVLWHAPIGHIDAGPLLHDDTIYVPADRDDTKHDTAFFALDAATGKTRWSIPQPGQPWGSPQLNKTGDIILTTTGKGQIGVTRDTDAGWAFGISPDGKKIWETRLSGMPLQPSIYLPDTDIIIHTLKNGDIVALNAADGKTAWIAASGGEIQAPSTLIENFSEPMIATITYDGMLIIRGAVDGRELHRQDMTMKSTAAPLAHSDTLYVLNTWKITAFTGLGTLSRKQP